MKKIITHNNFSWYAFHKPSKKEFRYILKNFNFDPLDIEDCQKVIQRPKLDIYKKYFFMVLRVPFYDHTTRCLQATEIDLFLGDNFLITIQQKPIKEIKVFFQSLREDQAQQEKLFSKKGLLFYDFLNNLYLRNFRILDHIAEDLEKIEDGVYQGEQKEMVKEISIVQRNIINFRRIMRTHDVVLHKMIKIKYKFLEITRYFHKKSQANLLEHLENSWDIVNSHKETIEALQKTNEGLISWRMNRILLVLTIITVSALPATFFGISTRYTPWYNNPMTFWYLVGFTLFLGFVSFWVLRKKKVL